MLAHPINHRQRSMLSPKAALRAHVAQMHPAQQREFISAALKLLAARALLDEMEDMALYLQAGAAASHKVF